MSQQPHRTGEIRYISPRRKLLPWLISHAGSMNGVKFAGGIPSDDQSEATFRGFYSQVAGAALSHVITTTANNNIISAETAFDCPENDMPSMTIEQYLHRIARHIPCCGEVFTLAMVYLDRMLDRHETLALSIYNVHRLLAISFVVGCKYWYDRVYSNRFYARVAGVTIEELNTLELEFLILNAFDLFITDEEWVKYNGALAGIVCKLNDSAGKLLILRPVLPSAPSSSSLQTITPTVAAYLQSLPSRTPTPMDTSSSFITTTTTTSSSSSTTINTNTNNNQNSIQQSSAGRNSSSSNLVVPSNLNNTNNSNTNSNNNNNSNNYTTSGTPMSTTNTPIVHPKRLPPIAETLAFASATSTSSTSSSTTTTTSTNHSNNNNSLPNKFISKLSH